MAKEADNKVQRNIKRKNVMFYFKGCLYPSFNILILFKIKTAAALANYLSMNSFQESNFILFIIAIKFNLNFFVQAWHVVLVELFFSNGLCFFFLRAVSRAFFHLRVVLVSVRA